MWVTLVRVRYIRCEKKKEKRNHSCVISFNVEHASVLETVYLRAKEPFANAILNDAALVETSGVLATQG